MQSREIECKYRVDASRIAEVSEALGRSCVSRTAVNKRDEYYRFLIAQKEHFIRLRKSGGVCLLTYKEKHAADFLQASLQKDFRAGLECNTEYESEVSDEAALRGMFVAMGAELYVVKEKRGEAFVLPAAAHGMELLAELVEVPPLGYFLEIECLTVGDTQANAEECARAIARAAQRYGVQPEHSEARLYMDMLRDAQGGQPGA